MEVALKVQHVSLIVDACLDLVNVGVNLVVGQHAIRKGEHDDDLCDSLLLEMSLQLGCLLL